MNAPDIARALGAARRSGRWWRSICPVHGSRSGRSFSLALRDHPRGLAMHCHAGCSHSEIIAALRSHGLIGDGHNSRREPPSPAPSGAHDDDGAVRRAALARAIWNAAGDASGSPVVHYLAARHLTIPAPPSSLRWAPALRRPDGTAGPAMVARIDGPDGSLIGIARTWIERDAAGVWRRTERAMLGRAAGGAVRLAPAAEALLIGEGIESMMAAMMLTGYPGWAALSAGSIARLILPDAARDVLIAVDRDASGTGERAARAAAARWLGEGRRVRLIVPHMIGADAADLIPTRARAEARHAA